MIDGYEALRSVYLLDGAGRPVSTHAVAQLRGWSWKKAHRVLYELRRMGFVGVNVRWHRPNCEKETWYLTSAGHQVYRVVHELHTIVPV